MSATLVSTQRTRGQPRSSFARVALGPSQIDAYYQRFGLDCPWGFADPSSWKCTPRYCSNWDGCPGGAGL